MDGWTDRDRQTPVPKCLNTHIYKHIQTNKHIHSPLAPKMDTDKIHTHTHIHAYTHTHTHTCMHTHMRTHTHAHACTHTHTHTHTSTHKHTPALWCVAHLPHTALQRCPQQISKQLG